MKGYWYIATCYTKFEEGYEAAYEFACKVAAEMMMEGFEVFSPIAHSHSLSHHLPKEVVFSHDFWMARDEPLMAQAVGLVVCMSPNWEESKGIAHEIDFFRARGKPIMYREID